MLSHPSICLGRSKVTYHLGLRRRIVDVDLTNISLCIFHVPISKTYRLMTLPLSLNLNSMISTSPLSIHLALLSRFKTLYLSPPQRLPRHLQSNIPFSPFPSTIPFQPFVFATYHQPPGTEDAGCLVSNQMDYFDSAAGWCRIGYEDFVRAGWTLRDRIVGSGFKDSRE